MKNSIACPLHLTRGEWCIALRSARVKDQSKRDSKGRRTSGRYLVIFKESVLHATLIFLFIVSVSRTYRIFFGGECRLNHSPSAMIFSIFVTRIFRAIAGIISYDPGLGIVGKTVLLQLSYFLVHSTVNPMIKHDSTFPRILETIISLKNTKNTSLLLRS